MRADFYSHLGRQSIGLLLRTWVGKILACVDIAWKCAIIETRFAPDLIAAISSVMAGDRQQ